MNELADMRRADGFALRLRTRNNHQLDSGLGKNLRKRIVIQAGRVGKRFFADIPPRQIQCRGDACVRVTRSPSFRKYDGNVAEEII